MNYVNNCVEKINLLNKKLKLKVLFLKDHQMCCLII